MRSETFSIRTTVFLAALALSALAAAAYGQGITDPPGTCGGANCQSQQIMGTYSVTDDGLADCFQAQILTEGNECLRIQMFQQDTDLEMVLVCPNGDVWRDDDSGGSTRPLIKAETSTPGWCTLQVCHWSGGGSSANFRLRYGRYRAGNPNCASPTEPLSAFGQSRSGAEDSGKE